MTSILFAIIGLGFIFMMVRYGTAAFLAGIFIIFGFTYRIVDMAYLDLAGPIFAIELSRHVGGNGATPMFVLSTMMFLVPLAFLLRAKRVLGDRYGPLPQTAYLNGLSQFVLVACCLYLMVLFFDMLRIGSIPLLSGMDRTEYSKNAGIFHNRAYELNFLFSAVLGTFTVLPRLQGRNYSMAFPMLMLGTLFYWALTGNRFSIFFATLSFFAIPFAASRLMIKGGRIPAKVMQGGLGVLASAKFLVPVGSALSIAAVIGLLFNSYYEVRSYADPMYQIGQRVLVQPVQTWASTWDMVHVDLPPDPRAIDYVLINPPDADSNTAIRYLMELELGYFRARELIDNGQQYAGGYPEIFFHLFGFWLSIFLMALLGLCTAGLLQLSVRSLCRGMPLTSLMAIYLFYGFSITYIGGMLNFLLTLTYWIKVILLIIVWIAESRMRAPSQRLPQFFLPTPSSRVNG